MIIGVIAFKGGVTKTTTASNLADALARHHGKRVLLVDCDLQCQSTISMGYEPGAANDVTFSEVLATLHSPEPISLDRTFLRTRVDGLTLVPGDFLLKNAFTRSDPHFDEPTKDWFRLVLEPVRDRFDLVVFDAPHDRGAVSRAIIEAADLILIPIPQEPFAVQGAADTIKVLNRVADGTKIFRVLLTKIDKREPAVLQDFNRDVQPLVGSVLDFVRYSSDVKHAQGCRKTVFEYNPQSTAAQDYLRASQKILNLNVDDHGKTQPTGQADNAAGGAGHSAPGGGHSPGGGDGEPQSPSRDEESVRSAEAAF